MTHREAATRAAADKVEQSTVIERVVVLPLGQNQRKTENKGEKKCRRVRVCVDRECKKGASLTIK